MKWLELSIQVSSELAEPVSYLFGRYGRAFSIEDLGGREILMRTYLTSTSKQKRARIEVGLSLINILKPVKNLVITEVDGINWKEEWKKHFTLLRIGSRIVIKPPWKDYMPHSKDLVVELDPGLAFGTGHHPTTAMCLESLEIYASPDMEVIDLGSGSGILSITAVLLGARSVIALDVDPSAVKVAKRAVKNNKVKDRIRLINGTLPQNSVPENTFDIAMANISSKIINHQAGNLHGCLKKGGILIVGGFLEQQECSVRAKLSDVGFRYQDRRTIDDWVTLIYVKV